jgi:hypothetical protein
LAAVHVRKRGPSRPLDPKLHWIRGGVEAKANTTPTHKTATPSTMFPPVEASVLAENPDFAKLHATLTTDILNSDGTTKADPASKARDAVRAVSLHHTPKAVLKCALTYARMPLLTLVAFCLPFCPRSFATIASRQPSGTSSPRP